MVEENTVRVTKVFGSEFDDGAAVIDICHEAAAEWDDIDVRLLNSDFGAVVAVRDLSDVENKDESEAAKEDKGKGEG